MTVMVTRSLEDFYTPQERWALKHQSAEALLTYASDYESEIEAACPGLPWHLAELDPYELHSMGVSDEDVERAARIWTDLHDLRSAYLKHHINILVTVMPYAEQAEVVYKEMRTTVNAMNAAQKLMFDQLVKVAQRAARDFDDHAWDPALQVAGEHLEQARSAKDGLLEALAEFRGLCWQEDTDRWANDEQ